jgi:hypothetical protein
VGDGNGIKAPTPSGQGKLKLDSRESMDEGPKYQHPGGAWLGAAVLSPGIFFQKGEMKPGGRKFMLGNVHPRPVQRISAHVSEDDLKMVTEDSRGNRKSRMKEFSRGPLFTSRPYGYIRP